MNSQDNQDILIARESFSPKIIIWLKNLVANQLAMLEHYPAHQDYKDQDKIRDAEQTLKKFDKMIEKYHTYQNEPDHTNIPEKT